MLYLNNLSLISISLFIFIYVFDNVSYGANVGWISNSPSIYFQDPNNWDSANTPTTSDDVFVQFQNSFILVQDVQSIQSLEYLNTTSNSTLQISNGGSLSMSKAFLFENSNLSINSTTPSTPSLQSLETSSLIVNSTIDLISQASTMFNYVNITDSIINMDPNGNHHLNSKSTLMLRTKINQPNQCNTTLSNVVSFTGSIITSNNSILNIDNSLFYYQHLGIRSTNMTLSSTTINANNCYIYTDSSLILKDKSKMNSGNMTFVTNSALIVDNSTVSFNGTFYSVSTTPMIFRNGAVIQALQPQSEMVFGFTSSVFFENSVLDINGDISVHDNAVLYFSQNNRPRRPIYITLTDNAKIVFINSYPTIFNTILSNIFTQINAFLGVESHLQTDSQSSSSPTPSTAATIDPTDNDVFTQINLNDNSKLELEDSNLDSVIINTNRLSQVLIKNNVVFSNSHVNNLDSEMLINTELQLNNTAISLTNSTIGVVNGGAIKGVAQINGDVLVRDGGKIGNVEGVTRLNINGNLTGGQNDSSIAIRINSRSDFSQLNISNNYNFYGIISISLSPAASVDTGYTYILVNYNGGKITFTPQSSGVTTYVLYDGGRTAAPLPSHDGGLSDQNIMIISVVVSLVVIGLVLASVLYVRRRREKMEKIENDNNSSPNLTSSKPSTNQLRASNSNINIKLLQIK